MEARICKWVVILVYVHYINVYFSDFLFYIYIDILKKKYIFLYIYKFIY